MPKDLQSKKIIIIGPAHPIRPGGITTFNERLCKAFLDEGHHCSIYSFFLQYPSFLFPGTSQFTDGPPPVGIKIHPVINSVNPVNWFRVGNRLKKEKPDLVVVRYWIPFMGPCLGTILRILRHNKHTRIACIADNVIPHEHRPGDKIFTRYFVRAVDFFIVMSRQVLKDLQLFTAKPVHLLPHPLYDNFGPGESREAARENLRAQFGITTGNDEPLAVFFGLVRHYKGLDILIDALGKTKNNKIRLLVAGEFYEDVKKYTEQVAAAGLPGRVIIHEHFIPAESVKHFICAADVIVQPYRSATQSGVTPVAYHFEVPMIVTNVGGLPETVPHQKAGLVTSPDAGSIAASLDEYFELGRDFFTKGLLEEKKKLSWERLVEALLGREHGESANGD